jgi:cytoskeletal protein CcmA (bactofilin family)
MFERERHDGQAGEAGGTSAFLGKGSRISGKVVFEGTGRIEGHVEGEIVAQDTLIIGEGAVVKAKVSGSTIIVHGQVIGDLTARQRLELRTPCKVTGNLVAPSLIVHDGATFEGQCSMNAAGATKERAAGSERRDPPPPAVAKTA